MAPTSNPQATPPPTGPGATQKAQGKQAPANKGQIALGALFAALFTVVASLYKIITTGDLRTLTEELNSQTKQLTVIDGEIQAQQGKTCNQAQLAYLKNQADQVRTQIQMLNTSMNTMSSAATSAAAQLGKIVDTEKNLLAGITSNW